MKSEYNVKRETVKKNIYLILSILCALVFLAGVFCTVLGDASPIKVIIHNSPIKLIVPPMLLFFITSALYRNSKRAIQENSKK